MALDEALLLEGPSQVSLRFYTWSPDTLSLGYFQRLAAVPPAARFQAGERGAELPGAVVRRLTGGGAIHHDEELTFSIVAPLDHPLYHGKVEDSYRRVHAAITSALAKTGITAEERGSRVLESERAGTGMCFHKSAAVDLIWDRKKGVGSAQRRKGGRVLHHGSIKLGTTELEGEIATLSGRLSAEEMAPLLRDSFAVDFEIEIEDGEPRARELELAEGRREFFTSAGFIGRR